MDPEVLKEDAQGTIKLHSVKVLGRFRLLVVKKLGDIVLRTRYAMREGATSSNHRLIMGKRTSINKCHYLAQPFDVLSPVDLFSFLRDTITRDVS